MPQPLRRWIDGIEFHEKFLAQRPELATMIARIAAAWSMVEVDIGFLLAEVLDTDARTGVSMYLALTGSAAQDRAFSAAVEACLPQEMHLEFSTLLKDMRSRGKERNNVLHALWSIHPNDEKKLINCPPANIVRTVSRAYDNIFGREDVLSTPPSDEFVAELSVYEYTDFDNIISRVAELREKIQAFFLRIAKHNQAKTLLERTKARRPLTESEQPPPDASRTNPKERQ
jgi:hypothetical protein